MFIKEFTDESATYENLYNALYNLRILLKHNNKGHIQFTITDLPVTNPKIKEETFTSLLFYLFRDTYYEILEEDRILINDQELIKQILYDNHDAPTAGHQGFERTYNKIKYHYYWENMKNDIKDYIKHCKTCQISKTNFRNNKSPMQITTTASKFCEQIAIDFVGPLPETRNGNRFILTLQDDLTKFIQAFAMETHDAQNTAIHTYFKVLHPVRISL